MEYAVFLQKLMHFLLSKSPKITQGKKYLEDNAFVVALQSPCQKFRFPTIYITVKIDGAPRNHLLQYMGLWP